MVLETKAGHKRYWVSYYQTKGNPSRAKMLNKPQKLALRHNETLSMIYEEFSHVIRGNKVRVSSAHAEGKFSRPASINSEQILPQAQKG